MEIVIAENVEQLSRLANRQLYAGKLAWPCYQVLLNLNQIFTEKVNGKCDDSTNTNTTI